MSEKVKIDKNEEYIQSLEEKNRIKKNLIIKTKNEKELEDRERGLHLLFFLSSLFLFLF